MAYQMITFPVGSFQCNCSLIFDPQSKQCIVVDPGDDGQDILDIVTENGLKVRALWHTHAHIDHIGATKELFQFIGEINRETGLPPPAVYLHEGDRWLYENVALQSQFLGLAPFEVTSSFEPITDGQTYEGLKGLKALHTPGHTPGSCCLAVHAECEVEAPRGIAGNISQASRVVLSGDTLFRRSIGRTDLWGGNSEQIIRSIRGKLLNLDPNTLVIPGHGPVTKIEEEAEKNPFLS